MLSLALTKVKLKLPEGHKIIGYVMHNTIRQWFVVWLSLFDC